MVTAVALVLLLAAVPVEARGGRRATEPPAQPPGPEVAAHLGFLSDELDELAYQLARGEIAREEYLKSRARIEISRETVLRLARSRGEDVVPELHVLTEPDLTELFVGGKAALAGARPGDVVQGVWLYHGRVRREAVFYVVERVGRIERDRPY
jgi:hypothetical protein